MKNILAIENLTSSQIKRIETVAPDYQVVQALEEVEPSSIEIVLGWTDELIPLIKKNKTNIQWVQFQHAGVNTLPLDLFAQENIQLTNGSGIHTHSVTETTMGLILGMTRKIVESSIKQQEKKWMNIGNLYELNGKTMLIVGAGSIGEQLGKVAQAFGMHTIGINRSGSSIRHMDEQYVQDELVEIIEQADILVNILPATEATMDFYDTALFSKMKDMAYFVNVGRGESVVEEDLLDALNNEELAGVGLDVFKEEPLPTDHPFWLHEKIVLTPHIAGNVENPMEHILSIFLENLETFTNKQGVERNLVQLDKGY